MARPRRALKAGIEAADAGGRSVGRAGIEAAANAERLRAREGFGGSVPRYSASHLCRFAAVLRWLKSNWFFEESSEIVAERVVLVL